MFYNLRKYIQNLYGNLSLAAIFKVASFCFFEGTLKLGMNEEIITCD